MKGFEQLSGRWRFPFSPKTAIIIAGAIIVAVVVVVGARWLVKSQVPEVAPVEITAVSSTGTKTVCKELSGEKADSCVWKAARQAFDPELCQNLEDSEKQDNCSDSVYRALADRDMDISWCEKIAGEIVRTRCVNSLSEQIAETKGCSGTRIDQSVCDHLEVLNQAIESEDPDECAALESQSDQVNCLEMVGNGDRDHDNLDASLEAKLGSNDQKIDSDDDGLTDLEEYQIYHTSPGKADTDGDGYGDLEELKNGYNPLGSGRL